MMACQKIPLSSSRKTLLLFVIFSLGLCLDGCDIGECSSVFKAAYSKLFSNDIDSLCRDVKQVSKCLKECQQVFFPHHLDINTTLSFIKEICDEEFVYDLAEPWDCIRNHMNKFFLCVARSSSIKSTSGSSSGKLISCRRKLMVFDCPEEVFSNHCEDEAVQIVSRKFIAILKPWLNSSCYGIPQNKVYNMDVNQALESDLDSTADCMDTYKYLAEDCFSEYLEKAAYSENHCWKNTMLVCNKPPSSIPCSSLSSVANFYTSLFSFGKLDCREPTSVAPKIDTNRKTNQSSPKNFVEPLTSTQSMQPPSFSTDQTDTLNFPETKPPFSITDLKPNDANIFPSNHNPDDYPTTDEINSHFTPVSSSLNVTSSEGIDDSFVNIAESHIVNEISVSSLSHYTFMSTLLLLSCIFTVIFFPKED